MVALLYGAKADGFYVEPFLPSFLLIIYEALFLITAGLSAAERHDSLLPWLPCRALQYLASVAVWLAVSGVPMTMRTAGLEYGLTPMFLCYLIVVSTKFYALGFMMATEHVEPIASQYWPLMVCVFHVCGPSTNFYLAGNLIYPYFPRGFDRSLYCLGAIIALFFV